MIDGSVMGEVEAQALRLYQRSLLPNVSAQPLPENVMDQVCRTVVALDVLPPGGIHRCMERRRLELLGQGSADDGALGVLPHAYRPAATILGPTRPGVTHLAA